MRLVASALIALAVTVARPVTAAAACPASDAACALQAEGVALLVAGNAAGAADKFAASIAVRPSARAYLGYSQALEGLGKLALAYDVMATAKELSDAELAATPLDPDAAPRAERIKYKLAELIGQVGLVQLRMPDGVPRSTVVAIARPGEPALAEPFAKLIAVAPAHAQLTVTLRDGRTLPVAIAVDAGATAIVTLPLAAPAAAAPAPAPAPAPGATPPAWVPPTEPETSAWDPLPQLSIGAAGAVAIPNVGSTTTAFGGDARIELRALPQIALTATIGYLAHPDTAYANPMLDVDAGELLAIAGVRSAAIHDCFAILQAGVAHYVEHDTAAATGGQPALAVTTDAYVPAVALGVGLRVHAFTVEVTGLWLGGADSESIPVRAMFSLGYVWAAIK